MNVRKLLSAVLLMITATALFGCASRGNVKADPGAMAKIGSIAILETGAPPVYTLDDYANPLGVVVAAVATMSKEEEMNVFLREGGFDFKSEMNAQLEKQLIASGYGVKKAAASREKAAVLKTSYADVTPSGTDALIDMAARIVGYASKDLFDSAYRPYLWLSVRLVQPGSEKVLYQEDFLYGYSNPFMPGTELPAPKEYYFKTFDDMRKNKSRVLEGLKLGTAEIARTVAQRLAKNGNEVALGRQP